MNRWKVAFFVVVVLAIASNGFLIYLLIESAVSYGYLHDSYTAESKRFDTLGELVVAGSDDYTQADILHLLRQAQADAFIVEENDKIFFKGVEFAFVDDRLVEVR